MNGVGVYVLALFCPLAGHKKQLTVKLDEVLLKMQVQA